MKTTLNIYGQAFNIQTATINGEGIITVTTERGEWSDDPYYDDDDVKTDDDAARMLFTALAPVAEAELYPTFNEWCKYMDRIGDDVSERNSQRFERWRVQVGQWATICDISANDALDYLNDNYDI